MLILEDVLLVSADRVASCRNELRFDVDEIITRFEQAGFSRKEILVAMNEVLGAEFASLPDIPRLH
ncbi:hypothetical protein QTL95_06905 [Rhizobium sp. S152]|uniref:hypothetical protein n=1 Tax=Rhizobium sp. S152 TaxID=3055038 RepID=UPI0025A9EADE|nr:hypothetical protein [Rhizobium sp. S152]MDM9625616.1 hypothetical protein [Rhizobium sp. S152]